MDDVLYNARIDDFKQQAANMHDILNKMSESGIKLCDIINAFIGHMEYIQTKHELLHRKLFRREAIHYSDRVRDEIEWLINQGDIIDEKMEEAGKDYWYIYIC